MCSYKVFLVNKFVNFKIKYLVKKYTSLTSVNLLCKSLK